MFIKKKIICSNNFIILDHCIVGQLTKNANITGFVSGIDATSSTCFMALNAASSHHLHYARRRLRKVGGIY